MMAEYSRVDRTPAPTTVDGTRTHTATSDGYLGSITGCAETGIDVEGTSVMLLDSDGSVTGAGGCYEVRDVTPGTYYSVISKHLKSVVDVTDG
mmetsp:Transcript_24018/g.35452  ORF Transcript_24018/g.35452 Transcript_24018/m.35452 type:complete len:93 (+) Transcript_24018:187-465(+)